MQIRAGESLLFILDSEIANMSMNQVTLTYISRLDLEVIETNIRVVNPSCQIVTRTQEHT